MALDIFTGKSAGTIIKYNAITLPGWRKITIEEKGKPLPTPMDVTDAGDSVYTFVDDPLGGKEAENATVTLEGFLSVKDKADAAAGLLQFAVGNSYTLLVITKALGDQYTLANAVLKTFDSGTEVAGVVPYTMTWSNSTSAGVWDTAV